MSRRRGRSARGPSAEISWPSNSIVPADRSISRNSSRASVDLPQPDSPTSPSVSPAWTSRSTPSTARTLPTARRRMPSERTGKCLCTSVARSSTVAALAHATRPGAARRLAPHLQRQVTGVEMARRALRGQRRQLVAALEAVRAARREHAARRGGARRGGRSARDRGQPPRPRAVQPRDRAEQAPGVGMQRIAEHRARRALLDHAAGVHHEDPVGDPRDHAHVVRDQHDRSAGLRAPGLDQLEDLRLDRDVQRRRRLVGDQHPRAAGERHRDHHALAHAARELVRVVVDPALGLGDADGRQQLDRAVARACACRAARARGSAPRAASRPGRPG